jgi:hypothetical protein
VLSSSVPSKQHSRAGAASKPRHIKGVDFTTEFSAIQTAFTLAAPVASPTFTGTVTIPTADINGGTVDGAVVGGTTPAAGTFTALTAAGLAYPTSDGTAGQVIATDGSGVLSFTSVSGDSISEGNSSVEVIDTGSGRIEFNTDGTKVAEIDASGNMKFDSGYGSAETAYGCRAWVNFNGTGTVAIRESGNVSSITDNGTGDYTVNFTNALTDANYGVAVSRTNETDKYVTEVRILSLTTGTFGLICTKEGGPETDPTIVCASVFR